MQPNMITRQTPSKKKNEVRIFTLNKIICKKMKINPSKGANNNIVEKYKERSKEVGEGRDFRLEGGREGRMQK